MGRGVPAAGSAAAAVPCAAAAGRGGRPPTLLVPGAAAARGDAWFWRRGIRGKRGLYGRTLRSRAAWYSSGKCLSYKGAEPSVVAWGFSHGDLYRISARLTALGLDSVTDKAPAIIPLVKCVLNVCSSLSHVHGECLPTVF